MPSPKAGKVTQIHVKNNQDVSLGDLLMTLEVGDGEAEEETAQGAEEGATEQQEHAEADAGEAAREEKAEKQEKEAAERGTEDGKKKERQAPDEEKPEPAGEREPSGRDEKEEPAEKRAEGEEAEREEEARRPALSPGDIPAAPSTRRLARELGVDLKKIEGSGTGGWISAGDVKHAARETAEAAAPPEGRENDNWGPIRREPMPAIRKTIAKRMRASKDAAAHVTHFDDADVTELEAFRLEHGDDFEGTEFTPLPFIVRAALDALKDHPMVNASLDLERGEIIYKEYYSIGIAVATDRGLIVPVLRDAETLSIFETARAIEQLSERVRSGDFELKDLRGGTFSVSNLGAIGGRYATPIINYPEAAVLLPGRARKMPVVRDNDEVEVRLVLPLSLTYDHRLVDGAEAQAFLNDVKGYLEDPGRLLTR
jgi:pyruvate/2-oxoglutarate dehydrogenase complex dihydrolipoamide acyltransferase (E2) component